MLGTAGTDTIRQFVESGGSYLGMCAGGYFGADRIVFDDGGPLEVIGVRDLKFFQGMSLRCVYEYKLFVSNVYYLIKSILI